MGSRRQVEAPIRTQRAVLCLQYVTQTGRTHEGGQDCREEQLGTPCSPTRQMLQHRGASLMMHASPYTMNS